MVHSKGERLNRNSRVVALGRPLKDDKHCNNTNGVVVKCLEKGGGLCSLII